MLKKKVAIVHYWLVTWRGGEKVLEQLLKLYPDADIVTHVSEKKIIDKYLPYNKIIHTFISKLPFSQKHYQKYLPLMPYALEQIDLSDYDLIISSESGPAKNVVTSPDALHISYCHSPMRYVWDMYHLYMKESGFITRILMKPFIHYLKIVDRLSADRVDYFIANSNFISRRIKKSYRRDSTVIFPPVAIQNFEISLVKEDYYLLLGQLVSYKRADLVIDAFIENGRKLIVIGEGELEKELKLKATSNITFLGRQSFEALKKNLSHAKALIFPGIEDFGIVPLEAMASGTPVIAYKKGGVLDTIVDKETGLFFDEQTVTSLNEKINFFESGEVKFEPHKLRAHANKFSEESFRQNISNFINSKLKENN